MKTYVLETTSFSLDHYTYVVRTSKHFNEEEAEKFLMEHGNDVDEDECYEEIDEITCIDDSKAIVW